MTIIIGKQYRFAYPKEFVTLPDYSAHRGQAVTVTGELSDDEVDPENRPMYDIKATDGWTGVAWLDELTTTRHNQPPHTGE